jgi:hypothetical protein
MSSRPDPLEILRQEARHPIPTEEAVERAWAKLLAEMAMHQKRPAPVRRRRSLGIALSIGLAAVVLVVAFSVLNTGSAQAVLSQVARAAETAEPLEVPAGSYVLTVSERRELTVRPGGDLGLERPFVAYMITSRREAWSAPELVVVRSTVGKPEFFSGADEEAYYRHGIDLLDQVGVSTVTRFTGISDPIIAVDWPTDPDDLRGSLEQTLTAEGGGPPTTRALFLLAASLLRERDPSPQLRAAVLDVMADLEIDLIEQRADGAITVGITYEDPVPTRDSITIGPDGYLLAEESILLEADPDSGVSAGTPMATVTYESPKVVKDLPGGQSPEG